MAWVDVPDDAKTTKEGWVDVPEGAALTKSPNQPQISDTTRLELNAVGWDDQAIDNYYKRTKPLDRTQAIQADYEPDSIYEAMKKKFNDFFLGTTGLTPEEKALATIQLDARRLGMPKEEFINKIHPEGKAINKIQNLVKSAGAGALGTVEGFAGGIEWLSGGKYGQDLANQAKIWVQDITPEERGFEHSLASGVGSMATFFIPGVGVETGSILLAKVSARAAKWLGTSAMAVMEAMSEAGSVYKDVMGKSQDENEANTAATATFWLNMPLLLVTDKLGFFGEKGGAIRKGLTGATTEGIQEGTQEIISTKAKKEPIDWMNVLESAAVGAITGGVAGGIKSAIDKKIQKNIPPAPVAETPGKQATTLPAEQQTERSPTAAPQQQQTEATEQAGRQGKTLDDYAQEDIAFTPEEEQAYKDWLKEEGIDQDTGDFVAETGEKYGILPEVTDNKGAGESTGKTPTPEGGTKEIYTPRGIEDARLMRQEEPRGSLAHYDNESQAEWLRGQTPPKDGKLKLYRATPEGKEIQPGDYVTNSLQYARNHIKNNLSGEGKISSIDATLDDIFPADGPGEFWYAPKSVENLPNPSSPPGEGGQIEESALQYSYEEDIDPETKAKNETLREDIIRDYRGRQGDLFEQYGGEGSTGGVRGNVDASRSVFRTVSKNISSFFRKGWINLKGQEINSPGDLAALAQIYRDPRIETFRIFYVKDNRLLAHEGFSSNMPGFVNIPLQSPKNRYEIKNRMDRLGADGFYILHNHPSGNATPSNADIRFTETIKSLMPELLGHVIIDSGVYSVVGEFSNRALPGKKPKWKDPLLPPSVRDTEEGRDVFNSIHVVEIGREIKSDDAYLTVIYRGSNGLVRAIQEIPVVLFNKTKEVTGYIKNRARDFGAADVFIYKRSVTIQENNRLKALYEDGAVRDVVWEINDYSYGRSFLESRTPSRKTFGKESSEYGTYRVAEATEDYQNRLAIWNDWAAVHREEKTPLTDDVINDLEYVAKKVGLTSFLDMIGETKGKPSTIWKETGLARSAVDFWHQVNRGKKTTVTSKKIVNLDEFINEETGEMVGAGAKTAGILELEAMAERFRDIRDSMQRKMAGQRAGQEIYAKTKQAIERAKRSLGTVKSRIREITGQVRVNTLVTESAALEAAFKKAQQASRAAFKEGKRVGIDEMKYVMMLRQNRNILAREVRTLEKSLAGMAKKSVKAHMEPEYREAVQGLISGNLDLLSFIEERAKMGDELFIPEDQVEIYSKTNMADMTLDELRNLHSLAKMLMYQGRAFRKIMEYGKAVDLKERVDAMVESIGAAFNKTFGQEEGLPLPPSSRRLGRWAGIRDALNAMTMTLKKVEYVTDWLDGFKKFGPVWKGVFNRSVEAERVSIQRGAEIAKGLKDAYNLVKDNITSIINDKTIQTKDGRTWTHEEAIMVSLNSGNDGNLRRLREGYKLSDEDISFITANLTKNERQFVDEVFALVDSQREDIANVFRQLTGEKMKFVEGGYFPIVVDRDLSRMADRRQMEKDLMKENFYRSSVSRGFTVSRRGGAEAPLLKLDVIVKHLTETNHFVAHAVAVRDIQKIILNPQFKDAVTQSVGKNAYNQFLPWLKNIANGHYEAMRAWDKFMGKLRNNAAAAILGWSLSVAFIQPMAYTQAINRLGFANSMEGLFDYYKNYSDNAETIFALSPYMVARTQTFDADLRNIMEQDKDAIWKDNRIKKSYYALTSWTDKMVTMPTWWTAYNMEMRESGDQQRAVDYADKIVRNTQSSGMAKDLAEVQRGNNTRRAFVMFYSFFSSTYNEMAKSINMVSSGKVGFSELLKSYWWLIALPSIVSTIFKKGKDWPDEDVETILADLVKGQVSYGSGTIPIVNGVVNSIVDGYSFRPTPITSIVDEVKGAIYAKDVPKAFQHGIFSLGYLFGVPSRQMALTTDFIWQAIEDGELKPGNLIYKETKRR